MNLKLLGVLACLVLSARPAAGQSLFGQAVARTAGGDVIQSGLAVASSLYHSTVGGTNFEAHVQSVSSGGAQPMADTQGFGTNSNAIGGARVFYTFKVTGPGPTPVPVIVKAKVHVDTFGPAQAVASFAWQDKPWASRSVWAQANQSAHASVYEVVSLPPGFSQAFDLRASGQVAMGTFSHGNHGEFQAIADPEVYIDPTFPDRHKYSIVFSSELFPPGAPRCDISPVDSFTVMPGTPITFTVTGTAATAGETVTLNSTNLPASVVIEGTWPATGVSVVNRTFRWTPSAAEVGTYLLKFTVTNGAGQASQRTKQIHVTTEPTRIISFTPERGPEGSSVTIHGAHFTGVTGVLFNTVPSVFTVDSNGRITAIVPSGAGSGPIHILTDTDDVQSASDFIVGVANAGPPTTTAALSGPLGNSGWYRGDVTVALSATDPDGPADIAATYYTVDGGVRQTYNTPFIVSGDAVRLLTVWSVDRAGNAEALQTHTIRIDRTPPVITGSRLPAANPAGWNNTNVTASFLCSDFLSGLAQCTSPATFVAEGRHMATGTATDVAGNTATVSVPNINIDRTAPEAYHQFDPATQTVRVYGRDALSGAGPALAPSCVAARWVKDRDDDDDDADADGKGDDDRRGQAQACTFAITDNAGNLLVLVHNARHNRADDKAHETEIRIHNLQYGGGAVVTVPYNRQKFEWSMDRSGGLKNLAQRSTLGRGRDRLDVRADFNERHNETTISTRTGPGDDDDERSRNHVVHPGLVLIRTATDHGQLKIEQ